MARLTSDHDANRVFCVWRHENAPRVGGACDYAVWRDSRKTRHQHRGGKREEAASPHRSGAPERVTAAAAWLTRARRWHTLLKRSIECRTSCFLFYSPCCLTINKTSDINGFKECHYEFLNILHINRKFKISIYRSIILIINIINSIKI